MSGQGGRDVPDNVLRTLFRRQPKAYYPELAIALDSVAAAIVLQEVCHWERWSDDGWVFRTQEQIHEDTGLKRGALDGARKVLLGLGILEEQLRGVPARLHYRVHYAALQAALAGEPFGALYVMQAESLGHKIGISRDPNKRRRDLERELDEPVELVVAVGVAAPEETELRLHNRYHEYGRPSPFQEWFDLPEDVAKRLTKELRGHGRQFVESSKLDRKNPTNKNAENQQSNNTGKDAGDDSAPQGGQEPPPDPGHLAKHYTTLTIDRTREVGFEATGRQRGSWAQGFAGYVAVKEGSGAEPPDPEDVMKVVAKITEGATQGWFRSVKKARELLEKNGSSGAARGVQAHPDAGGNTTQARARRSEGYEDLLGSGDGPDQREESLAQLGTALARIRTNSGPEAALDEARRAREHLEHWPGLAVEDVDKLAAHFGATEEGF